MGKNAQSGFFFRNLVLSPIVKERILNFLIMPDPGHFRVQVLLMLPLNLYYLRVILCAKLLYSV